MTLELALLAMLIALAIGIPAGIVSAVRQRHRLGLRAPTCSRCGASRRRTSGSGILLILLFSVQLGWLPASGYVSPFEDLGANLKAMIMPAFVLGNAHRRGADAAHAQRHAAGAVVRLRAHRAGQGPGRDASWCCKHALRNALTPIITLGALELGTLLSGAVLTEQVFTIPGFGKLIVDAVFNRDYAVVQGVVLVTATAYIAAEPAGRRGLLRGQSAPARTEDPMSAVLPVPSTPASRCPAGRPWRRAWRA